MQRGALALAQRLLRQSTQLLQRSEPALCSAGLPPCTTAGPGSLSSASRSYLSWRPEPATGCQRAASQSLAASGCSLHSRGMATRGGPQPRFRGGKIKLSTAFKERFKAMGDGSIRLFSPGFRHRRFRKSNKQRLRLKQPMAMHSTYANTLRRMGFK